jgi:hypothetical protein
MKGVCRRVMKRSQPGDPTLRLIPPAESPTAELPTGCWLMTRRCGYSHHGIYVGGGRVVHYAGLSRGWRRGPVEIVSFAEFSLGRHLWAKCTPTARYVGLEAVERALSRLGENNYRIMTNNCEHFCAWCLDGEGRSRQVDRWFARPRAAALAIAAWLANALTAFRIFPLAFQKSSIIS